jgi:two-component system, OmpR family, KDP operon response regulator KdpE
MVMLLTQYIDNACKYSNFGTTITIRVLSAGAEAIFSVNSFGPVIPMSDRERIFDRYYRSSSYANRAPGHGDRTFRGQARGANPRRLCVGDKRRAGRHNVFCSHSADSGEGDFVMMQPAIRILVVDDEPAIRRALRPPLMELGFQVAEASRGEEALQALRGANYDAVLLDINMPGIGGIETLRRIRAFAPRLPVLMLTVRDEEEDKVEALDLGADDYVTKPFSTRELIARIRSAVRRVRAPARPEDAPMEIGEIRLEPVKRRVTKRGAAVKLTRKEFDILYCLMSRAGRVVTYAKLLTAVWGAECREEVEYLRTFVRQLRKKIEDDPSNPVYLLTDVYVGYRFADALMFQEESAAGGGSLEPPEQVTDGRIAAPRGSLACLSASLFVVVQQAEDVVFLEALAAFQEIELDGEAEPGNHAAQLLHQLDRALHGAAGSEQIVDQHNILSGRDRVHVISSVSVPYSRS